MTTGTTVTGLPGPHHETIAGDAARRSDNAHPKTLRPHARPPYIRARGLRAALVHPLPSEDKRGPRGHTGNRRQAAWRCRGQLQRRANERRVEQGCEVGR